MLEEDHQLTLDNQHQLVSLISELTSPEPLKKKTGVGAAKIITF